ncbi:MAG: carboxypeptidase regulatory-like domain-containing protein [Bryobacterales bacterium]|nr:carboxypeptidase regulatory-like domain-containing protein [Bryobacterales bacterium]
MLRSFASVLAASIFLFAITLFAQSPIGTIAGTVTDGSGAVVSGASVTVTNKSTGMKREITSDSLGNYSAPSLRDPKADAMA